MRSLFCLLMVTLFVAAPAAKADSFQYILSSSAKINISAENDNYMGIYSTAYSSNGGAISYSPNTFAMPFSNISLMTPEGTYINSASLTIKVMTSAVGPAVGNLSDGRGRIPPPDTSNPVSIPPTIGSATAFGEVAGMGFSCPCSDGIQDGNFTDFNLSFYLLTHDNEISTVRLDDMGLWVDGSIRTYIATPGYNFASYVGGEGYITLPYTLELSGTYSASPVPEPSTLALLGTGLAGLAGIARRKFAA